MTEKRLSNVVSLPALAKAIGPKSLARLRATEKGMTALL